MNHSSLLFKISATAAQVLLFVLLYGQPPSCHAQIHLRDAMERAVTVNHGLDFGSIRKHCAIARVDRNVAQSVPGMIAPEAIV